MNKIFSYLLCILLLVTGSYWAANNFETKSAIFLILISIFLWIMSTKKVLLEIIGVSKKQYKYTTYLLNFIYILIWGYFLLRVNKTLSLMSILIGIAILFSNKIEKNE